MLDIRIPYAVDRAIAVVRSISDGTLNYPHLKRPVWNGLRITRVTLVEVGSNWQHGGAQRNGTWEFRATAQVFGSRNYNNEELLAEVHLKGCTTKHEEAAITADHSSWRPTFATYLGVEGAGEGQWKEGWISVSNLNGTPLL